ncbi:hypothetical protein Tco_1410020 [Tanacetum coccineum]
MGSNEDKTNYYNEYIEADRKARRLDQEAEKQQLFVQKVQQQNTTLTSQLELYKERVRVLENIKGDNNYLNEFLEADRQAKHFNQQAQSQFIRDQDIIRDLKQQRDKLDLAVIDYKRQKEEYQKTQTIFNQTQRDKEEKYLNDIIQLQAKNKDLENVVCKMGKSTETLRLLTNEQKAFRDNLRKSGLGYNGPYVLSQAYAKIPKLYRAYELCDKKMKQCIEVNKTSNVTQNEAENLKFQLFEFAETKFNNIFGKIEFFKKKQLDISELNKELGKKQNLFENKTSVFQIKIDELEKSLAKQIKENSDLLIKIDNLENVFADEEKRATLGKLNAFDNEKCDFESKVIHLEKIIAQKSKDFDDVNLELSNRTAKFEAYFEKLEKTKVVLERQLARKVDDSKAEKDRFLKEINHLRTQLENLKGKRVETKFDNSSILGKPPLLNNERDQLLKQIASLESQLASQDIRSCQKEYHELRTSYNALKVKFDSLNRKKWNINVSKSSKPKESVSEKVHTGESSKPFLRRVSQFTTYSLQKDRKFSKKSQSFETFFPKKGFKTRASNAKNQSFETSHSCFTPVKQVWRPIKESQTFEAFTSQKSFKTSTFKGKN